MAGRLRTMGLAAVLLCVGPEAVSAQSVLQRTPNVVNGWEGAPGTIYFNFLHRFIAGGAPTRKVSNYPTFLLAAGLPGNVLVGANYATNSDLVTAYPNEWEFFARVVPLEEFNGFPVDVSIHGGYNLAAESLDGELTIGKQLRPLRVMASARGMGNAFASNQTRFAVGGGATLQLSRWIALAGDYARLVDASDDEKGAWGAGLQLAIPFTPHTFSLQVTNTNTATIQGAARGSDTRRYGFEFTVPITLARYLRRGEPVAAPPVPEEAEPAVTQIPTRSDTVVVVDTVRRVVMDTTRRDTTAARRDTAVVQTPVRPPAADTARRPAGQARPPRTPPRQTPQRNPQPQAETRSVVSRMRQLRFEPGVIRITPGSSVTWRNDDQVVHTVKAKDGSWESPLIQPGSSWRRTFARAGTFVITCGPHPFMTQTVEVR